MKPFLLATSVLAVLASPAQRALPAAAPSPTSRPPSSVSSGQVVSALDSHIWRVFQGKDHAHWFGSDGQGVYRHDGTTLQRFTTEHGLAGDHVRDIQGDRAGNVYVASSVGGVSRFDGRRFTRLSVADPSTSEWKLAPDDLWFPAGQDTGAVYRWDGTTLHELTFPRTAAGDAHEAALPRSKFPNAKYSPYDVYIISRDSRGRLWFGTSTLGACRYDGATFEWVGHGENGSFGVRSIVEDKDGMFWLSNCVSRFAEAPLVPAAPGRSETGASLFRRQTGIASDADPFSVFVSALEDDEGNLWLATLGGGAWRYDWATWTHFPVKHDGDRLLIQQIYRDREHRLWLGTHGHGVHRLEGSAFVRFEP